MTRQRRYQLKLSDAAGDEEARGMTYRVSILVSWTGLNADRIEDAARCARDVVLYAFEGKTAPGLSVEVVRVEKEAP